MHNQKLTHRLLLTYYQKYAHLSSVVRILHAQYPWTFLRRGLLPNVLLHVSFWKGINKLALNVVFCSEGDDSAPPSCVRSVGVILVLGLWPIKNRYVVNVVQNSFLTNKPRSEIYTKHTRLIFRVYTMFVMCDQH